MCSSKTTNFSGKDVSPRTNERPALSTPLSPKVLLLLLGVVWRDMYLRACFFCWWVGGGRGRGNDGETTNNFFFRNY